MLILRLRRLTSSFSYSLILFVRLVKLCVNFDLGDQFDKTVAIGMIGHMPGCFLFSDQS